MTNKDQIESEWDKYIDESTQLEVQIKLNELQGKFLELDYKKAEFEQVLFLIKRRFG